MVYILLIIAISSASAFFIQLARKWGGIEWLQVHGNDFIAEMAHCDFCLSWWTNIALCLIASLLTMHWELLLLPLANTMLTRKLL
jgi:hypothetical protein